MQTSEINFKARITLQAIGSICFKLIFIVILFYNFHRYIFKYGSSDFINTSKEYVATPLFWQVGKYVFVLCLLGLVYLFLSFKKTNLNLKFFVVYFTIFYVLIINLISGFYYRQVIHTSLNRVNYQILNYDELEYVIFALMFFPLFYISNNDLKFITTKIDKYIVFAIWVLVISNLLVLLNYFIFDVLPFHGYEGSLLIRFGGFWDDPNAFSIFSCFLLFYSCHKKLWLESALLIINVVFAISFTGYVLLMVILFFYMIRNNNVLLFGIILLLVIALVGYLNLDFIEAIYELKKGSLESHSTGLVKFSVLPLTQPLIFHETWFISFMINYSPVSYIVIVIVLYYFIKIYFKGSYSIQNSLFLIFVISSLFLPFLYMFPLNILGFMLFVLNSKNIKF